MPTDVKVIVCRWCEARLVVCDCGAYNRQTHLVGQHSDSRWCHIPGVKNAQRA